MATKDRGRWRVQWTNKATGKRESVNFPAGTKKAVVEDFEAKLRLNIISPELLKNSPTVEEFGKKWLDDWPSIMFAKGKPRAPKTKAGDRGIFYNHIVPRFGHMRLSDVTTADLLDWQAELYEDGEGVDPGTIRNIMSKVSCIYQLALIRRLVTMNPKAGMPSIPREKKSPVFWSFDEKDRFLCHAMEADFEVFQMVVLATSTGPRPGELRGLKRDCLNFEEGFVEYKRQFCPIERRIVDRIKNHVPRRVYLGREVLETLANKRALPPDATLFPLNFDTFPRDRYYPLCDEAEVKRIHPHGWRHTCASHLIMLGKEPHDVKEVLGHVKLWTTMDTYAHLLESYKKGITDSINAGQRWMINPSTRVIPLNFR